MVRARVVATFALICAPVTAYVPTTRAKVWGSRPTRPVRSVVVSASASPAEKTAEDAEKRKNYIKNQRKRIAEGENYLRGASVFKEVKKQVVVDMGEQFNSEMVNDLKNSNYVMEKDGIVFHLAKDFGFCWGVERSIELAYSAIETFPDQKIHITNELIHNPAVNDRLHAKDVNFIQKSDDGATKDFSDIKDGDVVMLPAFGATMEEMKLFDSMNVKVVDTTCPWVAKVWNTVHQHQIRGLTSIIHGKYAHEETMATKSMCETFICVKNFAEAEYLADFMLNGGDEEEFMKRFPRGTASSDHFNPKKHLKKVGLANQTTMYKKETRAIGQLFQKTIMAIYGPDKINEHYFEFDTICDATQVRQDAVEELCNNHDEMRSEGDDTGLDFILVVGGFDSSNTAHLLEIPQMRGVRSYHINEPTCIDASNEITHRTVEGEIRTDTLLPPVRADRVLRIGVTSGASTPDNTVQEALSRVVLLHEGMKAKAEMA